MKNKIRNFGIISHIDHGKSTLADRFLELTHTIGSENMKNQILDSMELEREKGITIKLQPVRMKYKDYVLNMIDTPGHIDFSYEVSRSLAAIEGVILLVDVSKGIQAQTLANLELAKEQGLEIIPVVNKIDLVEGSGKSGNLSIKKERAEQVIQELADILDVDKEKVIKISAKEGTNIEKLLEAIIQRIPPPKKENENPLQALIFDFQYNLYKGIIAYIRVVQGKVKKGKQLLLIGSGSEGEAQEIGYFRPKRVSQEELESGDIGYVTLRIKEPDQVKTGDTITGFPKPEGVNPLPGYKEPKPVVFMGLFPKSSDNWSLLKKGLSKLKLNDPSLSFRPDSSSAFGKGFRCGFLGLLHAEVVVERLKREFDLNLATSAPSVCYKIIDGENEERKICSVTGWPDYPKIQEVKERFCELKIITPSKFIGQALKVVEDYSPDMEHLSQGKVILKCEIPFRKIMDNLYDKLKSATKGYASMDYSFLDWRKSDLVKLEILVAGEVEEAFSTIVHRNNAYRKGKAMVEKLHDIFPPQIFKVPLQAQVEGDIIARRTVRAKRKDVTEGLYGGDYSRKKKLLKQQRKGKKKLKEESNVNIPQEVFWKMFKSK